MSIACPICPTIQAPTDYVRMRGVSKMRRALRLMRRHTISSQETRSRIVLLRYGLPCPEVNYAIRLKGYSHVFFADMAYPDLKIIIEYDGRHHASRWLADSKRREALEDEGWLYIQVTAENLRDEDSQRELAERVAQRVSLRLGEPVRLCGRMTIARDSRWSEEEQPSVRLGQAHISLMNGGIGLRHDAISLIEWRMKSTKRP